MASLPPTPTVVSSRCQHATQIGDGLRRLCGKIQCIAAPSYPHLLYAPLPAWPQTGYNNTAQYWWAQNSYGTAFANQGVFKIAYGTALVGNPNETYALSCSLNPLYPTNPLKRWPLQVLPLTSLQPMPCYSYTTRAGDYLAGIADHFGIDLLQMVAENAYVLSTTLANRPDLSTSVAGKRLLLCGITKDLYKTAHLGGLHRILLKTSHLCILGALEHVVERFSLAQNIIASYSFCCWQHHPA